jgi:CRP/FNR family cyclic AMP-dependent transcriptional regulator
MSEHIRIPDEKLFRYSFHKAGTCIFNQGDTGTDIYILKKGAVTVKVDDQIVGLINTPNLIIGEMAYFLGIPRTATIEAIEDCEFIVIPGEQLYQHVMKKPELGIDLLKILSRRLANTTKYATRLERDVIENRNKIRSLQGLEELKRLSIEDDLINYRCITEEQLASCKKAQEEAEAAGKDSPSLLKLIIEKGFMTADQLNQFLEIRQLQE